MCLWYIMLNEGYKMMIDLFNYFEFFFVLFELEYKIWNNMLDKFVLMLIFGGFFFCYDVVFCFNYIYIEL